MDDAKQERAREFVGKRALPVERTSDLLEALPGARRQGEVVVFVGSAISSCYPSCLPAGKVFSDLVPSSLAGRPGHEARFVASVPFEILLCHGVSALGEEEIHRILVGLYGMGQPNELHRILARLLRRCRAVITPNFDTLIEDAFLGENTRPESYEKAFEKAGALRISRLPTADDLATLRTLKSQHRPVLFKIHGSIDEPDSLVYEINKEGKLLRPREEALRIICSRALLVFLGYSGADWDILPTFDSATDIREIIWNAKDLQALERQTELFLASRNAYVLVGDLVEMLASMDPSNDLSTRPVRWDGCDPRKRLQKTLATFSRDEKLRWYGAILARCGYGQAALPILEKVESRSFSVLLHLGEAAFYAGKYISAVRYAEAASEATGNRVEWIEAQLLICNALRQQGRHFAQLRRLRRLLKIGESDSRHYGTVIGYLAQNPLVQRRRRLALLEEAQKIRESEPWSSMLLVTSVIRSHLELGGRMSSGGFRTTSVEDLLLYARRLGHATEIVNSYRDIAHSRLKQEGQSRDRRLLSEARKLVSTALEIARDCGDLPGQAKGHMVQAEVAWREGSKSWIRETKKALDCWVTIEMPWFCLPVSIFRWQAKVALAGKSRFLVPVFIVRLGAVVIGMSASAPFRMLRRLWR